MASWTIEATAKAADDLTVLDRQVRDRIIAKLDWLAEHFDTVTPAVLHGEYREFHKLRIGDWRAAYTYVDRRDKMYNKKRR